MPSRPGAYQWKWSTGHRDREGSGSGSSREGAHRSAHLPVGGHRAALMVRSDRGRARTNGSGRQAIEIVRGAVAAAHERGLTVALTSLSEGTERHSWFDHVTSRGTRGLILLLSRLSGYQKAELRSRRLAFAVVDPGGQPDPDVPTVGATNWSGGLSATRHLIELGHHRIGVIGGRRDLLCSRARMDGYRSAMEAAGLPVNPR